MKQEHQNQQKAREQQVLRKKYTSYCQQMPGELSYQNIRLANFIQLQLTDLWDSLQQINKQNAKNQLKQTLSRSYNVFHEMKKLYNDLGMNFLYFQSKKLISSYGIIFVYLMDRIQELEKNNDNNKNKQVQKPKFSLNTFQQSVKKDIDLCINKKDDKQTKLHKRLGGVHLFNQSYARRVDYNVQAFKQLRQKIKQKQRTEDEKKILKAEQDRKFKKQVIDQLNDFNYLKVDGQQLYLFLNRHKKMSQTASTICLGDQLQKIAGFFKQSQHQALQFLRKQKNLQSFHQLTQGFNSIVLDYQSIKANQLFLVKDKIKQIFEFINNKLSLQAKIIQEKDKQIAILKQMLSKKCIIRSEVQCQTYYNFDEQIKQLHRKIITSNILNQELKAFVSKTSQQDRKQKSSLMHQLAMKQTSIRQTKQVLQQKINQIVKIQRKLKLANESNKSKSAKNPIQYFQSLSDQMKRYFYQQLKQQGFIQSTKHEDKRRNTRQPSKMNELLSTISGDRKDHVIINDSRGETPTSHQTRRRQSSFFKKGSGFLRDNERKSSHTNYTIPQQDQNSSNQQSQAQNFAQIRHNYKEKHSQRQKLRQGERQNLRQPIYSMKSKKIITIRPIQNQVPEKLRVFDIQQKNGFNYSQSVLQSDGKSQARIKFALQSKDESQQDQVQNNKSHGHARKNTSILNLNHQQQQSQNNNSKQYQNKDLSQSLNKNNKLNNIINKHRKQFQTCGVTQKQLQQSTQNANAKIKIIARQPQERQNESIQKNIKNQNNSRMNKNKDKSISKQYSEHNKQMYNSKISQKREKSGRKKQKLARPSCQLALSEKQYSQFPQQQQNQTDNIHKQQVYNHQQHKCHHGHGHKRDYSIMNEYNLTIFSINTPPNYQESSQTIEKSQLNLTKQLFNKDISNNSALGSTIMQKDKQSSKQKQMMKTTAKKLKQTSSSPYSIGKQNNFQANKDQDNRKTKINLRNNHIQSFNNTFHKNSDKNFVDNCLVDKQFLLQTQQNFSSGLNHIQNQIQNQRPSQIKLNNNNLRDLSKARTAIINSQHNKVINHKIQAQFGDDQVAFASRACATIQQFKEKVIKLHKGRCGQNCKHLQRYLDIYNRIKKMNYQNCRQLVKLHIQNMNDKLGDLRASSGQNFALPNICKK